MLEVNLEESQSSLHCDFGLGFLRTLSFPVFLGTCFPLEFALGCAVVFEALGLGFWVVFTGFNFSLLVLSADDAGV